MTGISRIHGGVTSETLHGGYQMTILKVAANSNQFTADSVDGTTGAITEGGFSRAIRAIQTIATTVYIGTRANGQFVVAVDGATAQPTGPAYDTDASPTVTERIKAVLEANLTDLTLTATVTDISGLVSGNLT
jgi:hypothetical protein